MGRRTLVVVLGALSAFAPLSIDMERGQRRGPVARRPPLEHGTS